MILVFNRQTGDVSNGEISVKTSPGSDPGKPWCKAAAEAGLDLDGLVLEVWDTGTDFGTPYERTEPMHCFTYRNAAHVLNPPPKVQEDGQPRRGRPRKSP